MLKLRITPLFLLSLITIALVSAAIIYYTQTFNFTVKKVGLDTIATWDTVYDYENKVAQPEETASLSPTGGLLVSITKDYGVSVMDMKLDVQAFYNGYSVDGIVSSVDAWYVCVWRSTRPLASGEYISPIEQITVDISGLTSLQIDKMRWGFFETNGDPPSPLPPNALHLMFSFDTNFATYDNGTPVPPDSDINLQVTVTIQGP